MREITRIFPPSDLEMVGIAFNEQIKSSEKFYEWTEGKILRVASGFDIEKSGISPPFILTTMISTSTRFFPNQKERNEVLCGIFLHWEEPGTYLDLLDSTIVSIEDEFKRILSEDMKLRKPNNVIKVERLDSFELAGYEQDIKEESIAITAAFRTKYIVDINYLTRKRM
jgi:hypothetical protein